MKIQVVRMDGTIEAINLVGMIQASEGSDGGMSALLISSTGSEYFFMADGTYDGWGMMFEGNGLLHEDAMAIAKAIEADREIIKNSE